MNKVCMLMLLSPPIPMLPSIYSSPGCTMSASNQFSDTTINTTIAASSHPSYRSPQVGDSFSELYHVDEQQQQQQKTSGESGTQGSFESHFNFRPSMLPSSLNNARACPLQSSFTSPDAAIGERAPRENPDNEWHCHLVPTKPIITHTYRSADPDSLLDPATTDSSTSVCHDNDGRIGNTPQACSSDISMNELASYMEHIVHIPGRMSEMAQRMYL